MNGVAPAKSARRVAAAGGAVANTQQNPEEKLKKAAAQLEGVFVEQLLKAMRETVPQGEGAFSGGSGEEMFTGLLDQHLATETPGEWSDGLASALYRQLRARLPEGSTSTSVPAPTSE